MFTQLIRQLGNLFTWFFTVAPWEQAIRVRAGRYVKLLEKGFYFRIPFVDRVFKQSVRMRRHLISPLTVVTLDDHVITCTCSIGFYIKDLFKLFNSIESPNDTIEVEVASLVSTYIGGVASDGCKVLPLKDYVLSNLNLSQYGLEGQTFDVISFVCVKRTYRLITGDLPGYSKDSGLEYREMMQRQDFDF